MLRAATGLGWADLLRQRVAQPLGLSLFMGEPMRAGSQQPAGHEILDGRLQPLPLAEAPERVWLEVLDPAGAVSLTVEEDARWLQWHLQALRGEATPLPRSYVKGLQDWQSGGHEWHLHAGRYTKVEGGGAGNSAFFRTILRGPTGLGTSGAWLIAIRQFVLHGLPTTSTRTSLAAAA